MTDEQHDLSRDLVPANDPILHEEMPKFDFAEPPIDPILLAHILAQSVIKYGGIGLAANQIGLKHRAFIIKADPMICMINPMIVGESDSETYAEEGCLTYPNLIINIKRSDVIRVRYTHPNADIKTEKFEGMTARIIQHEIDHLNGIIFQKRASKYHLDKAKNRMKKQNRRLTTA